jgi:hypothetical protein
MLLSTFSDGDAFISGEAQAQPQRYWMEAPVSFVQLIILPMFLDNLFLDYVYRDRVGNDRRELEVFCLYTKLKCRVKRSVPIKLISQIY